MSDMERRFATVLAMDIVGYSRLMGDEESRTLARLKYIIKHIVEPMLEKYGGRFVDLKGDGAIVEFRWAADALQAAISIQLGLRGHETAEPFAEKLRYRMGLNCGYVLADGHSIYGDVVNVAARLEALCEAGGIWIAGSICDQIPQPAPIATEWAGKQKLKNIREPVHAWRVLLENKSEGGSPSSGNENELRPADGAPTRGRFPVVAVVPLKAIDADPSTKRLAEGLTADIVVDLGRFRDLAVVARHSLDDIARDAADANGAGHGLSADYVLTGALRRSQNRVRMTAQLVELRSGTHVWTARYDREIGDVFDIQADLAERTVGSLGGNLSMGQITRNELARAKRRRPADLTAYELFLLGAEAKASPSAVSVRTGIESSSRAIELDPTLARAYAIRAWLQYFDSMFGGDVQLALRRMSDDAELAVEIDPLDSEALCVLAYSRLLAGSFADCERYVVSALELGPSDVNVLAMAACMLAYLGVNEQACRCADRALELDPRTTAANLAGIKDAYFLARNFARTVATVRAIPESHRTRRAWLFLTASLSYLGDTAAAETAKARLLAEFPNISAERMVATDLPLAQPADFAFFIKVFADLGLPMCLSAVEAERLGPGRRLPMCEAARSASTDRGSDRAAAQDRR